MLFALSNAVTGARRLTLPSLRVPYLQSVGVSRFWLALVAPSLWAVCLCAAQTQGPGAGLPPAPFAGAVISEWKGEVHVQLPATNMAAPKRGQVLPAGTVLETGEGRLVLILRADESEILVQPHTRLVVSEPAPGNWNAVEILLGRVRAYIRKRTGGAPPFQMGTPSAVIAVRGTRFDVEVNGRGVSEVDVFDGLVEVASVTAPGSSVLVSPGFSTRVAIGASPEPPVPTREIRPGVEAPDEMAKLEFARERARADRFLDSEIGDRSDSGVEAEAGDDSRETESEKGKD
ncbi:MAG: FecR family protein [Acidobacteriia bacterium]|nr:FecR family protein [Terriglobia bacterium]